MALEIDAEAVIDGIVAWLAGRFAEAGFSKAVLGLSGGIDSAAACALAARALGPGNVWAVLMPYRSSDPASTTDARAVVEATGVNVIVEEISSQIDDYFARHEDADRIRRGNKMARERMSVLYDHSRRLGALVVGTGNRTEALLGYTTTYGDNACALNPIGDLLKTQVRQLARALGLPGRIIEKPPSADLWAGQTDEEELGFTYEAVDPLLDALYRRRISREEAIEEGFGADLIDRVVDVVRANAFKGRPPPVALLEEIPGSP